MQQWRRLVDNVRSRRRAGCSFTGTDDIPASDDWERVDAAPGDRSNRHGDGGGAGGSQLGQKEGGGKGGVEGGVGG
jgi:hypothetical protein